MQLVDQNHGKFGGFVGRNYFLKQILIWRLSPAAAFRIFATDQIDGIAFRQDDQNWWVTLTSNEGGISINLARYGEHIIKPGTVGLYFKTSDLAEAHKELSKKGAKVNDIQDDLFGPGSGVKFFQLEDPDGTQVTLY